MQAHHDPRTEIDFLVYMGDSTSDEGTFAKRKIAGGIISNNWLVDLSKSPHGRFTNGYAWDDMLSTLLIARFLIEEEIKTKHEDRSSIAEDIASKGEIEQAFQREKILDSDTSADYQGERCVRTFCEGGLTSHTYTNSLTIWPKLWSARKIVATLPEKRTLLLASDKQLAISAEEKKKTLIIEWSGGNDLITVNAEPTKKEADLAVAARMENIKKLYESGYRNFALYNLPDLSTTPRYQSASKSDKDRENAKLVTEYFNEQLAIECAKLQAACPGASMHVIDIHSEINKIYNNPRDYGFDPAKRKTPFFSSEDYKKLGDTAPSEGYMFSDDIHPTADAHALIAKFAYGELEKIFKFKSPPHTLKTDAQNMFKKFMHAYKEKLHEDRNSLATYVYYTPSTRLPEALHKAHASVESAADYTNLLAIIIKHGISTDGARTRQILLDFGWIDNKNAIDVSNPSLAAAKKIMDPQLRGEAERKLV